jgi:excisionase family DNA binding protein
MPAKKRIFKIRDRNLLLAEEVMLTVRETAAILRCHRSQIYEYIQADYLTAHCPNGPGTRPMHIRTESVQQFIKNYSIGGTFGVAKMTRQGK